MIYELVGLNYSIEYILDQYPSLTKDALIKVIEVDKDAQKYLQDVDWQKIGLQELSSG